MAAGNTSKSKDYVYRREFSRELARRTGTTFEAADEAVIAFLTVLRDTWAAKRSVCFDGFGVFELRTTSERMGRNPRNMEDAVIPAGYKPVFRASRGLKESVTREIRQREAAEAQEGTGPENPSEETGG